MMAPDSCEKKYQGKRQLFRHRITLNEKATGCTRLSRLQKLDFL